jgi:hypothetical protein
MLFLVAVLAATRAIADERLKGKACRSVHLQYRAEKGTIFYNEMAVDQSAPGTYFCVCGFRMGYFGIQELANGKKVVIFSVWDPGKQNNPNAVEDEKRVKLVHQGVGVRVKRFGNEGTGGQSFFVYDWKIGETYRLMVKATPNGNRTEYSGYFYLGEEQGWKHLVTFSTLAENRLLQGYYSFVEDFRRNVESTKHTRTARFGNGWVKAADTGEWQPLLQAKFTGDRNPVMNINAGLKDDRFYLATGGDISNDDVKLWKTIEIRADDGLELPTSLP